MFFSGENPPSRLYVALFACILAHGLFQVFFAGLTDDTTVLIDCSLSFLRHGGFYEYRNEVNPPLIVFLYALPALLMMKFPAVPVHVFLHGLAFLMILGSLLLLWRVLKGHGVGTARARQWLIASAFAITVPPASIIYFFGDREHLIFIMAMPWLAEMLLQKQPRWHTTLLAAAGFCIKPHAFILCLLMALFAGPPGKSFVQRTFLNPVPWIMGAAAAAYVAAIFVFFPGFIDLLPVLLTAYPLLYTDWSWRAQFAAVFGGNIFLLFALVTPPGGTATKGWLAFSGGLVLLYFLNGGWEYTYYYFLLPLSLFAVLTIAETSAAGKERRVAFAFSSFGVAALAVYAVIAMTLNVVSLHAAGKAYVFHRLPGPLQARLRAEAGDSFVMLSTTLWSSAFTTLNAPPWNAFAYDVLWPMPWFYNNRQDPKAPMVFEAMARPLARTLSQTPAPVLFVDVSPRHRKLVLEDDFLTILRRDPAVEKALTGYRQTATIDMCDLAVRETGFLSRCKFQVWRKDAGQRQRSEP